MNAGKLYEAASEFEWAKKLMPEQPDPRVNLALTMERAGRVEDALDLYRATLEIAPDYLQAVQGAASLALRTGRQSEPGLEDWLKSVALRGSSSWREWALEGLSPRQ